MLKRSPPVEDGVWANEMLNTKLSSVYDQGIFDGQFEDSLQSARAVARHLSTVQSAKRGRLGCGLRSWLKAFIESGVERTCGIDGDYVNREPYSFRGRTL